MIPASVRIFVYTEPVDMRRGFDGLALIARNAMTKDPRSGALFIFVNRRADRLKALWWDRNGYCVLYKRAHRAVFCCLARMMRIAVSVRIDGKKLGQLLAGAPKVRKHRAKLRIVG
jgi:transposase